MIGVEYLAGPLGLLVLAFNVWALLHVGESRAPRSIKALWIGVIMALPPIGFLLWLIAGPRAVGRPIF